MADKGAAREYQRGRRKPDGEVEGEAGDKSGNPKMRHAKPFVENSGISVETVLPEVVVVTKAPAAVQVEVVTVWMVAPLGRTCTVVVMLSGYPDSTLVYA